MSTRSARILENIEPAEKSYGTERPDEPGDDRPTQPGGRGSARFAGFDRLRSALRHVGRSGASDRVWPSRPAAVISTARQGERNEVTCGLLSSAAAPPAASAEPGVGSETAAWPTPWPGAYGGEVDGEG